MTDILAPVISVSVLGRAPDVVQSCVLLNPVPSPPPEQPPVEPVGDTGITTPVAPGVTYENLQTITTIVDTSPSQIIGCINDTGGKAQSRLNALFPSAIEEDGVVERSTNDIWVLRGGSWVNVGPTPGPTISVTTVVAPWNEIVLTTGTTRTKLIASVLNYALELETTADPITTKTEIVAISAIATILYPPVAELPVEPQQPKVSTGAIARVDAALMAIEGIAPRAAAGAAAFVPISTISIESYAPQAPRLITSVPIPVATVQVVALPPVVAAGAAPQVPVATVSISGITPQAGGILTRAFDLFLLVEDDLLNLNV